MKLKYLIAIVVFLFILATAFFIFTKYETQQRQDKLFSKIESINQLITAKQIYRDIIYLKETKDILWLPIKNKEFLISVDYVIQAGIDLSKGYKIENSKGITTLTVPEVEIFSIDADDSTINEYYSKQRFYKLTKDDFIKIIAQNKERILKGSSISSLLELSRQNSRETLKRLLKTPNTETEIIFSNSVIRTKR